MTLASPLALALLVPWVALAIWLLWARHRPIRVPFIELWRGAVKLPRSSRQFSPPPLSLIAILGAMLLAILAATGPTLARGKSAPPVTLVFDRGISMSAPGRISEVLNAVKNVNFTRRITVPADPTGGNQPTCVDTSAALRQTIANLVMHSADVIVVLTDQPVRDDPRVVTFSPINTVANVAIAGFDVREHPTTQAMVTLRNDSPLKQAGLTVDEIHRSIDLPPTGERRNYFLDLPTAAAKAQATLDVPDDFAGDNAAYLTRQRENPRLEMHGSLAREVRRIVEAYQSARPASDRAATITIVASQDQLKDDQPAIISPLAASRITAPPTAADHPVTKNLNVAKLHDVLSAPPPTGDGWSAVISADHQPLVAVREHPARQVWIGFTTSDLPRTTDFVILWTNALDWLAGGGGETFASVEVGQLSPDWKPLDGRDLWPGFCQRSDGAIRAANAPAVHFAFSPSSQAAQSKLQALLKPRPAGANLAPYLSVAAIICALIAACLWPRRILTAFSAARTV